MGLEGWAVEEVVFDSPGNKVAAAEVMFDHSNSVKKGA